MKSWYELTKEEAKKLEQEFLTHKMAKDANVAMHFQIILAITILIVSTFLLTILIMNAMINWYMLIILLLSIIISILLVVGATIEYHNKFNSYLEIKYNIIKK